MIAVLRKVDITKPKKARLRKKRKDLAAQMEGPLAFSIKARSNVKYHRKANLSEVSWVRGLHCKLAMSQVFALTRSIHKNRLQI